MAHGGLRFISEEQKQRARAKMRVIVADHLPSTNATITFTDSYPAMGPTEENKKLLNQLSNVSEALGFGQVEAYDPGRRGAADISLLLNIYLVLMDWAVWELGRILLRKLLT